MCTRASQIPPQTAADAVATMRGALDFLARTDLRGMGTCGQAETLAALEGITARLSAVRAAALAVFDAAGGPEEAGCQGAATWLVRNTQATRPTAKGAVRWSRTLAEHPAVAAALAAEQISEPFARLITGWTGKLPEEMQDGSDKILLEAAAGGCGTRELQIIYSRLWETHRQSRPDDDGDDPFEDRGLHLNTTLDGAGRLTGDLTAQCAANLQAVLDALGKKAGPEDTRTPAQRQHDALEEALAILLRSRQLPDRAGGDTVGHVNIPFGEIRQMQGASVIEDAWLHASPGEPVWLTGKDAEAAACDATLIPVVTGHPDWIFIDQIIEITLDTMHATARALTADEWAGLQMLIAKLALDFVSGPFGVAAALRAALTDGTRPEVPLSYPLDIGYSEQVPGWMRRAIINRDRHCSWPGGCDQPPARCQVHHIRPKKAGGRTSMTNCLLMCAFHHLVCIHRWGWMLQGQAGQTLTVTSPDGTTVYRSHAPPAHPAA